MVRTAKSKSAPRLKLADHIVHDQTSHPWSHIGFTATKSLWWSYYCLLLLECQRKTVWCMIKLAPRQLSCTPRQRCCLGTQHLKTEVSCLALAEQGCRQHSPCWSPQQHLPFLLQHRMLVPPGAASQCLFPISSIPHTLANFPYPLRYQEGILCFILTFVTNFQTRSFMCTFLLAGFSL